MSGDPQTREFECPVGRAISVLQEKWMLHIVHALLDGPRGFNELGRAVGGCNPTTLAQRLARLEDVGLVVRRQDVDGRGRGAYSLTAAGEGLSDVIEAIRSWSLLHLHSAQPLAPRADDRHDARRSDRERDAAGEVDPLAAS